MLLPFVLEQFRLAYIPEYENVFSDIFPEKIEYLQIVWVNGTITLDDII